MMSSRFLVVFVAFAFIAPPSGAQCPPTPPGEDPFLADQVMVRVAWYSTIDDALALIRQSWPEVVVTDAIESRGWYMLGTASGEQCLVEADLLANFVNPNPQVPDAARPLAWAELNYEGQPGEGKTGTIYIGTGGSAQAAMQYGGQFAVELLGIDAAHSTSRGAGVQVAVLDTGVDGTHPALAGRVLPGVSFITGSRSTGDMGDGSDNDGDGLIDEMTGHGTFVSGLITLVAPDAAILPVVVLDSDGVGDAFTIAKGVYYAIDSGADVINMSLGSTYNCEIVEVAVSEAVATGLVAVAAAGNLGQELEEFPAARDSIGVAALDDQDVKADFSNYNDRLFISAPGDSVPLNGGPGGYDPDRSVFGPVPGAEYAAWKGTSFATAFVSGGAALVRAQHPDWNAGTVFSGPLCPGATDPPGSIQEAVEQLLECSAVDVYDVNPQYEAGQLLGVGRIDIGAAVALGPIPGDLDGDNSVGLADLSALLSDFGRSGAYAGDIDGDGYVGIADLSILLSYFGFAR
ncbi:MAG: S8 family serine peptidase [Phycisphaerae bacterium]|jgi:subtilisin family serine protease